MSDTLSVNSNLRKLTLKMLFNNLNMTSEFKLPSTAPKNNNALQCMKKILKSSPIIMKSLLSKLWAPASILDSDVPRKTESTTLIGKKIKSNTNLVKTLTNSKSIPNGLKRTHDMT
ncbi:hypothetical protein ACO0QE_003950 [Hanseniaspora vineae]